MAAARTTSVLLQAGKKKREFEIAHAERILRMPSNGGWELPKDSKYRLDKKDGLTIKRDTGDSKKPKEKASNK